MSLTPFSVMKAEAQLREIMCSSTQDFSVSEQSYEIQTHLPPAPLVPGRMVLGCFAFSASLSFVHVSLLFKLISFT